MHANHQRWLIFQQGVPQEAACFQVLHLLLELGREQASTTTSEIEVEVVDAPEAMRLSKKRNSLLCEQFTVLDGAYQTGGTFLCNHCKAKTFKWKTTWNASKARKHIEVCCDAPIDVRAEVAESSQASKKKQKTSSLVSTSATGTLSSETVTLRTLSHTRMLGRQKKC